MLLPPFQSECFQMSMRPLLCLTCSAAGTGQLESVCSNRIGPLTRNQPISVQSSDDSTLRLVQSCQQKEDFHTFQSLSALMQALSPQPSRC